MWILSITALLISLGLQEFLQQPPENQPAAAARRWELPGASDHSRAYGYVIKNINNAALQSEALSHHQQRRPLFNFFDSLRRLQRSELEIDADITQLTWLPHDNITSFFARGQLYFNEMVSAHPGFLHEYSYLRRMMNKLPSCYQTATEVITGSNELHQLRPTLERSIAYLKQTEAKHKVAAMDPSAPGSSGAGTSRAGNSGAGTSRAVNSGAGTSRISDAGPGPSTLPGNSSSSDIAMLVTSAIRKSLGNFLKPREGGISKPATRRFQGSNSTCNARGMHINKCFHCGSPDHFASQCPHNDHHRDHHHNNHQRGGRPYHNHNNNNNRGNNNHYNRGRDNHNHNNRGRDNHYHMIPHWAVLNTPHTLEAFVNHTTAFIGLNPSCYLLDSAATTHVTNNLSHMTSFTKLPHGRSDRVITGAGPLTVEGYGLVTVMDENGTLLTLTNVMLVPTCPVNLISTIKINQEGGTFTTTPSSATINTSTSTLLTSKSYKGIYSLTFPPTPLPEIHTQVHEATEGPSNAATFPIWHARFGHVGIATLSRLLHGTFVDGLKLVGGMMHKFTCTACTLGKFKKTPQPLTSKPVAPLDILHSDVCGPLPVGLNGHRYFVTVRDNCTGYTMASTISEKNEAFQFIKHCISYLELRTKSKVKAIRLDKGGEFTSNTMKDYMLARGIHLQFTATECSASNGVAERVNLTIMDRLRATLAETNQPRLLWPWAVNHIVTAMNFLPSDRATMTPHEALFGTKPCVSFLKCFGAKVIAWVPTQEQTDKLAPRGTEGRLVGYVENSTSMYKVNLYLCCRTLVL